METIQAFDEYCADCNVQQRKIHESLRKKMERVDAWESQRILSI